MKIQLTEGSIKTIAKVASVIIGGGFIAAMVMLSLNSTPKPAPETKPVVNPLMQEIQDWRAQRIKTQSDINAMAVKDCEDIQKGSKLMIAGAGLDFIEAQPGQFDAWLAQKDFDCSKAKYSLGF